MTTTPVPRARYFKISISLILFIVLAAIYWVYNRDRPSPSALPDVTLNSLSGHSVSLRQLKGEPLVLNLWATWCPPCRAELPLLERIRKMNPDIRFYFAEQGNSRTNVAAFSKSKSLPSSLVLLDPNTRLSKIFGTIGYPTTIFYNALGHIVAIHRGELTKSALNGYLEEIKAR